MKRTLTLIALIGIVFSAFISPTAVFAQNTVVCTPPPNQSANWTPKEPVQPNGTNTILSQSQQIWKIFRTMTNGSFTLTTTGVRFTLNKLTYCGPIETAAGYGNVLNFHPNEISFFVKYGTSQNSLDKQTNVFTANATGLPKPIDVVIPNLQPNTDYFFELWVSLPGVPGFSGYYNAFGTPQKLRSQPASSLNPSAGGTASDTGVGTATDTGAPSPLDRLEDPLGGKFANLPEFVKALIDVVLVVAIPIVALLIIYSGFLIVTARGNEQKLSQGKKAFTAAIIGGAIVLGAYVIASAIGSTVDQIRQ